MAVGLPALAITVVTAIGTFAAWDGAFEGGGAAQLALMASVCLAPFVALFVASRRGWPDCGTMLVLGTVTFGASAGGATLGRGVGVGLWDEVRLAPNAGTFKALRENRGRSAAGSVLPAGAVDAAVVLELEKRLGVKSVQVAEGGLFLVLGRSDDLLFSNLPWGLYVARDRAFPELSDGSGRVVLQATGVPGVHRFHTSP